MDREAAELRDAMRSAPLLEPHHPGPFAVHFDDQAPEPLRLSCRSLHLRGDPVAVELPAATKEGLGLLAVQERDEPVDVVGRRPPDRDRHAMSSSINESSGSYTCADLA